MAFSHSLGAMSESYTDCSCKVELNVQPIRACNVSAPSPVRLRIAEAEPGDTPNAASDDTSSYAISTNVTSQLRAFPPQIPGDVDLFVSFGNSGILGATSQLQLLSSTGSTASDTVIFDSIPPGVYNGNVSYALNAPVSTSPIEDQVANVDYELS